jgi:hypothetical protein
MKPWSEILVNLKRARFRANRQRLAPLALTPIVDIFVPEVRPSMHGKSRYPSSVITDVMHAAALWFPRWLER